MPFKKKMTHLKCMKCSLYYCQSQKGQYYSFCIISQGCSLDMTIALNLATHLLIAILILKTILVLCLNLNEKWIPRKFHTYLYFIQIHSRAHSINCSQCHFLIVKITGRLAQLL